MHTSVTPGAVTLRGYQGLMMTRGVFRGQEQAEMGRAPPSVFCMVQSYEQS